MELKQETLEFLNKQEEKLKDIFNNIDLNCQKNSLKVLNALHNHNASDSFFSSTTGYGYNDL